MSSVDDRIVNMHFNNKQFTQGVTESQKSLQSLDKTLADTSKGKGLTELASGIEKVSGKFGAMKVAGITAVATITNKAVNAGLSLVKSLTIDPILAGFQEYQVNLNSIQTIMANTGAKVAVVNTYLQDLNHYSDQTIYNFSQMASAIGKFTAAGVSLPNATVAIKGMANAAALSGADANQLNTAMYQMSQALSSGSIKLQDWNSLVNANMGGKNIQNALMATAHSMGPVGKEMDKAIKSQGSFRESLQKGWLTSEVFTKTMKVMAGTTNKTTGVTEAFSVKQLIAMKYTKQQAVELNRLSKASIDAATKIKTFPQMMDVVKEAVGSGFGKIFQDVFGNFDESVTLWTKVGTTITGVVGKIFGAIDTMLTGWRTLGGYTALWNGIGNVFKALGNIIRPFVTAFKTLLPETGKAGEGLANASKKFESFTEVLVKVTEGFSKFTPTLISIFNAFKIGVSYVGKLISALAPLLPLLKDLGKAAADMLAQGAGIGKDLIAGLLQGLNFAAIQAAVTGFAKNIITWIKDALGIASPAAELVPVGLAIVEGIAQGIVGSIGLLVKALAAVGRGLLQGFKNLLGNLNIGDVLTAAFAGGIFLTIKNFAKRFEGTIKGFTDIGKNISGVFGQLTNTLKTMQQAVKAKIIRDIAIAVGILTLSVIALTFVDPVKLATSLSAIGTMLGELVASLYALGKLSSQINMTVLAASILLISFAILNLSAAVILFGKQDPKTLAKGLGAMATALGIMLGAMLAFSAIGGPIKSAAASMFIISTAMTVLAAAVLAFGLMPMDTLKQGLAGMALGLGLLIGALLVLSLMQGSVLGAAASIVIVATAMVILSAAVAAFGMMDMETLAKGLGAVAVGLGIMVGALLILAAAGPMGIAAAGSMILMAGAINILMSAIIIMGHQSWETIAKGLTVMAAALTILLVAGALAIEVAPGLIILGAAVLMLGAGMALAGVGMALFGAGFAALAASGTAGVAVLVKAFEAFIALLPKIAEKLAEAFVAFFEVLAKASTKLREAFGTIFKNILGVVQDSIPEIGKLLQTLITTGINVLKKSIPQWVEMGFTIIDEFLKSAAKHVPEIANSALTLIRKFIDTIAKNLGPLADSAAKLVIKFIQGIADAINNNIDDLRQAGLDLALAIINGMTGGLASEGVAAIKGAVEELMSHIPGWAKKILGIGSPAKVMIPVGHAVALGVAKGIAAKTIAVVTAVKTMANAIIAEGDAAVLKASQSATRAQAIAYAGQAKADIEAKKAAAARRYADRKQQEAENAKDFAEQHKKDKAAQKRAAAEQKAADAAKKRADAAQSAADVVQKRADAYQKTADAAKASVAKAKEFADASLHGKGDIKSQEAIDLADRASRMLEIAKAEAAEATKLAKTNKKAGQAMLLQSRKDEAEAKRLAASARESNRQALDYYRQEVDARIAQLEADAKADEEARRAQAEYDVADTAGKADILTRRAEANEARAREQKALAEKLIADARTIAATDAATAMKYLDQAENAAQAAQSAADQAYQERQQAEQQRQQAEQERQQAEEERKRAADEAEQKRQQEAKDKEEAAQKAAGVIGGGGGILQPSRSVLEDAARAVDRYTASLAQASQLAGATQGLVQFTQINNSPEALSASEIYRQSKNLLSAAEIKMGVSTSF